MSMKTIGNLMIIGLTGKAGSGFDTDVTNIFETLGFSIIRSDDAVDAVWKIPEVLVEVADVFGREKIFDNALDSDPRNWVRKRGVLGELVSSDVCKQDRLNDMLQPYISTFIYKRIKELKEERIDRIVLISSGLARGHLFLFCQYTWYIDREEFKRREELLNFYKFRGFDLDYVTAKVNRTMRMQCDVKKPSEFNYDVVIKHPEDLGRLKEIIVFNLEPIMEKQNHPTVTAEQKHVFRAYKRRGQFTRSLLSLSQFTDLPIRIEEIDSLDKKKEKIQPSLVACAEECAKLCNSNLDFNQEKRFLEYSPGEGKIQGEYNIVLPLNTSISPLIQTVLPFSLLGDNHVKFTLNGCTELSHSAPVNYFIYVFFPLMRRFGAKLDLKVLSRGFFDKGFGKVLVTIDQIDCLERLNFTTKGECKKIVLSRNSIGFQSGQDEKVIKEIQNFIRSLGFLGEFEVKLYKDENSAIKSFSMSVALETEHSLLGADIACDDACSLLNEQKAIQELKQRTKLILLTEAALDPFCCDQMLLYLAIAGGSITIPLNANLDHFYTQLNLINSIKKQMFNIERHGNILRIDSEPLEFNNE